MTTPNPTNMEDTTWKERFTKQFVGVDKIYNTDDLQDFIRKELQLAEERGERKGREEAVKYIRQEFNDDRYAEMWPEDERDEDDSREGSAAEFWMFFNPILDEAMNPFNGDVCEKHQAPDCMPCFYTTPPQEHRVDTQVV